MPLPPMFEESNIEVTVMITETDGTRRTAELEVPDRTEDELAEAILTCVRGVAVMRGPGLTAAIERWIQIMADDATVDRIGGARGYSADAVIIDEPFVDDVKAKPGSYLVLQLLEAWRDELRQDEDLAGEAAIDSASKVIATAMKRRERERAGND
ncbi:MAG: hypothetical protein JO296_21300 [Pseudonocardiales bacterium]|nr:hypothetical protein [Pseudonocardiales bacterium]